MILDSILNRILRWGSAQAANSKTSASVDIFVPGYDSCIAMEARVKTLFQAENFELTEINEALRPAVQGLDLSESQVNDGLPHIRERRIALKLQ